MVDSVRAAAHRVAHEVAAAGGGVGDHEVDVVGHGDRGVDVLAVALGGAGGLVGDDGVGGVTGGEKELAPLSTAIEHDNFVGKVATWKCHRKAPWCGLVWYHVAIIEMSGGDLP